MAIVTSRIGSLSGTYHEYSRRDKRSSPPTDLLKPPFAYTRWLPYSFEKNSYLGSMVKLSEFQWLSPPYVTASTWDAGCTTADIWATQGSSIAALSNLVEKWKNSEFNLGVSIGEGKESLEMVSQTLFSLVQSVRCVRRGDLGSAVRHFKNPVPRSARRRAAKKLSQGDVSGSWLALNLGWAPMISDIYSALEYKPHDGGKARIVSGWIKGTGGATVVTIKGTGGKVTKVDVRMRYVTVMRTPATEWQRLGLTNPALVAWELVPLSFVIDYFVPIGDAINALGVLQMDNIELNTFREERVDIKTLYPSRPKGAWMGGLYAVEATSATRFRYRTYKRSVVSLKQQLLAGSLECRIPSSYKKVANMAALLHQNLLNLRR